MRSGSFGIADMVLVSHPDRPFNNLNALVQQLQKSGAKELSIAHWGQGTLAHLAAARAVVRAGDVWSARRWLQEKSDPASTSTGDGFTLWAVSGPTNVAIELG